jgi:alpha-tubulin suppressor-like RCC1 family protein
VLIDSGVGYSQISLGASHACGITTTGALKCWGLNSSGQLGNNTTTNGLIPVLIDSSVSYSQISLGASHTCGTTMTGALKCWGLNSSGQLGNNTTTNGLIPVLIDSGVSYLQIALNGNHTCGITNLSALKCWGSNTYGQLGLGPYRTDIPWHESFGITANASASLPGTAPYITNITATPGMGSYGINQLITLHVQFSQNVTVTTSGGTPRIALNITPTNRFATYASGSGTSTLDFTYTVGAGDYSLMLDSASYSALVLNGGTINATTGGAAANLYLPVPSLTGSLSANQLMMIRAYAPSAPTGLALLVPASAGPGLATGSLTINTPQVNVMGVASGSTVKLFTDSACSSQVGSALASASSVAITTSALAYGEYSFYANATDSLGNISTCSTASASYAYYNSVTPATVTNITSPVANGTYSTGQVLIQVQFSRYMNATGVPTLALNTTPSRTASYLSGSGTKTLVFAYTITSGDAAGKLDSASVSALSLTNGANIADVSGTNAILTLAAPGSAGSLGANKNIVIGVGSVIPDAPATLSLSSPTASPGNSATPAILVSGGGVVSGRTVTLYSDQFCTSAISAATAATATSVTVAVATAFTAGVNNTIYARVTNGADVSVCSSNFINYIYSPIAIARPTSLALLNPAISPSPITTPTITVGGLTVNAATPYLVSIFNDATCTGAVIASNTVTATSMSVTISPALTLGSYVFYANQSNQLGSVSPCTTVNLPYLVQESGLSLSTSFQRVAEGSGAQSITFSLANTLSYPLTINYDLGGTTAAASLYSLSNTTNNSVVIPAGSTSVNLGVSALSNALLEGDKFIQVNMTGTSPASVYIQPSANQTRMHFKDLSTTYDNVGMVSQGNLASHECAIKFSGQLYCWGSNNFGQIGDGTLNDRSTPTLIDSGVSYVFVAVGATHTCGITSASAVPANTLKCWGKNSAGQLGDGTTTNQLSPVIIDIGVAYAQVVTGHSHSCALTAASATPANAIKCWGNNSSGQVGDTTMIQKLLPTTVDVGVNYALITAGAYHTCGVTTAANLPGKALKCWGFNASGQIGDGTQSSTSTPLIIDSGVTYASVSGGLYHTCGITSSTAPIPNALKCWGDNSYYELGDGTQSLRLLPTAINAAISYTQVSSGAYGTCARTTAGSGSALHCWGTNNASQIGDGTNRPRSTPTVIAAGQVFSAVTSGLSQTCALHATGTLNCWGANTKGQLAQSVTSPSSFLLPQQVDTGAGYLQIANGSGYSCGITSSGALKCWGLNTYGQLGNGSIINSAAPILIDPSVAYSKVGLGQSHSCGITTAGTLKCWGDGTYGQLGNGTYGAGTTPAVIDPGTSYSQISLGTIHTCGVTTTGVLKCWGYNTNGGVGNGVTTLNTTPVVIDSGVSYSQISLGSYHSCGITSTGILKCWGYNVNSQIGNGTVTQSTTPVVIDSGVSYSQIGLGTSHTCGITTAGALKCWGLNTNGQLGNNSTVISSTPFLIDSGTNYSQVVSGSNHTCGITTAGALKCWGGNAQGQLGNNSTSQSLSPITIDSGVTYTKLSPMPTATHTCAITSATATPANTLKCWGDNSNSQIGQGQPRTDLPWLPALGF